MCNREFIFLILFIISVSSLFEFEDKSLTIPIGEYKEITLINNDDDVSSIRFIYFDNNKEQVHINSTSLPIEPIDKIIVQSRKEIKIKIYSKSVGQITLNIMNQIGNKWIDSISSCNIAVMKYKQLQILQQIIGWGYFLSWMISFYPQVIENFRRKSVVGLSFDYLVMNLFGFICYSIFNLTFVLSERIRVEYFISERSSVIPVEVNDIVFSIHAAVLVALTLIQCCIYERGNQRVTYKVWTFLVVLFIFLIVTCVMATQGLISYLSFLYYLSYVKLIISFVKLIPQAYLNYRRQSTVGWSIGNIILDSCGGLLSIVQMVIISFNFNDWSVYFGNPTKFLLGIISIAFDVVFIIQHYCLYYGNKAPVEAVIEEIAEEDETRSNGSNKNLII